jgi:hypothetical protein
MNMEKYVCIVMINAFLCFFIFYYLLFIIYYLVKFLYLYIIYNVF